ncbi:MAG: FAD-dependent oxidoreductase [Halieaceae bacterium]
MIAAQLADLIGAEQVSADDETLAAHRFDRWCLKHWQDWQGEALDAPACVVRPRDTADVQAVVRFAAEHNVPIVPWGLGSGVCGGVEPRPDQVLIDMSAMNQVLSIDEENLLLTVEAGINGLVAEEAVAERGLTTGRNRSVSARSAAGCRPVPRANFRPRMATSKISFMPLRWCWPMAS